MEKRKRAHGCKPGALPAELTAPPRERDRAAARSLPSGNNKAEPATANSALKIGQLALGLTVAGLFESFAGPEFRHARCRDLYLGTGARIAAGRGLALRNLEIAKPNDAHRIALLQRFLDALKGSVHRLLGRILGERSFLRHLGNQISFVHGFPSFRLALTCGGPIPHGRLGTLRFTNKWCMTEPKNAENQQNWSDSRNRAGP